jgi:hypothetical protein
MLALDAQQRERHRALAQRLRPAILEFEELLDGYAARFSPDSAMVLLLAEFVTLERLCCPFFTLAVETERDGGPLRLKVTGPAGIKPFIRAEFGIG